ncbi:MAG: hypothetical protein A4E63_02727 [Syntrophorhabdus sp. PtaU1.Bin050]|nr:MAG: hypothetical protein A4E63_02727 [Syntrophorhabdus sp. PtaU1.Bin050]
MECKGCYWNAGIERLRNRFGYMESVRNCRFYGYIVSKGLRKCKARREGSFVDKGALNQGYRDQGNT